MASLPGSASGADNSDGAASNTNKAFNGAKNDAEEAGEEANNWVVSSIERVACEGHH